MVSRKRVITIALLAAALAIASMEAWCAPVTMDRMLKEHRIYVATTESEQELSRYWVDWRPARGITVMPMAELFLHQKKLEDGAFVFLVIDRSKAKRMIPEEEELLPVPTSGIGSAEVLVYSARIGNKRSSSRQGRWDVLITAPNEKWLHYELERLSNSGILTKSMDERGTVLDRFDVKRLAIVSTEGKQLAEDWVRRQTDPGRNAIDWDFFPADSWGAEVDPGVDLLFLLNKEATTDKTAASVAALPEELKVWFAGGASRDEVAAEKQPAKSPTGQDRTVAALVAPCGRQLDAFLDKYSSMERIPEALARHRLTDLSPYSRVVVVARPGDRGFSGQERIVDDFAGKVTSALSSGATGFKCESRQDLKELIYESLRRSQGDIDAEGVDAIRTKLAGNYALVVADLAAVTAQTNYVANAPRCSSEPYPPFDDPKPSEPSRPNPSDRRYGIFGPRLYPEGEDDPRYKDRLRRYRDEYREYEHDMDRWEDARRDYESRRYSHDMEWVVSVDSIQSAKVTGNLRVYDLSSFGDSNTSAGKVIFSCPINGSSERRITLRSDRVTVRGEDSRPENPRVPDIEGTVQDQTVLSDALQQACETALREMMMTAILPRDKPNAALANVAKEPSVPETIEQKVEAEALGAIKLKKSPKGDGIEVAREAALNDAMPRLLEKVRAACPGAQLTDDQIRDMASIASEGWDPESSEYRVRVRFEGQVVAQAPADEVGK